jgi:hypothetical protein
LPWIDVRNPESANTAEPAKNLPLNSKRRVMTGLKKRLKYRAEMNRMSEITEGIAAFFIVGIGLNLIFGWGLPLAGFGGLIAGFGYIAVSVAINR